MLGAKLLQDYFLIQLSCEGDGVVELLSCLKVDHFIREDILYFGLP